MADTKISALAEHTDVVATDDELVIVDKSDTTQSASGTTKRIVRAVLFNYAEAADLSTIEPDAAAAAGSNTELPRADHQHAIATDAPNGYANWGIASAEGSATSFARSDHAHGIPFSTGTAFIMPLAQYAAAPVSTATGATNTYYTVPIQILAPMTLTGIEIRNGATTSANLRCALWSYLGVKLAERTSDLAQAGSTNANRKVPFDATYDAVPGSYYATIWFSSATATAFMAYVLGTRAATGTNAGGPLVGTLATAVTAPVLNAY